MTYLIASFLFWLSLNMCCAANCLLSSERSSSRSSRTELSSTSSGSWSSACFLRFSSSGVIVYVLFSKFSVDVVRDEPERDPRPSGRVFEKLFRFRREEPGLVGGSRTIFCVFDNPPLAFIECRTLCGRLLFCMANSGLERTIDWG